MVEAHSPKDTDFKTEHISGSNDFLNDNHSFLADENRTIFYDLLKKGRIFLVRRCSDARGNIPELHSIDISNIATDGPQQPYKDLMIYDGVRAIIELTHYDGEKFKLGKYPEGCGGLMAKELQLQTQNTSEIKKFGLPRYVEAIKSPDPVVLAYYNAESIASHTHKPVLAAIQDHVRGIIYPLAFFQKNEDGEMFTKTKIPIRYMLQNQYDQREIYKDGIPTLDPNKIPDIFKEFLELHESRISDLNNEYPNLHDVLRSQNPEYILITTEKMAARIRYPKILKDPGSYFQIHIPRDKNEQVIVIDQKTVDTAVEQAQYPITIEHFSRAHTILIETGDFDQSKRIANNLARNEWLEDWLKRPTHQILTAESRAGKTVRIEEFKT